ncbi:MAG TPA: pilus assembly PilX N-terminal domain-containing protein, partial [Verrucomicrobiae bacterium]|nr:pilus assembly PilX N-terminal domain-containing protein [Verrucomicrobiae bacterium]
MRGSALIVTVLISATLTLLGLAFLSMADTETMIAASGRDSEQLLHTADTGVRMVKAWFDQPVTGNPSISTQVLHKFLGTYDLRNPALFDRTKRLFDHDGDPNTPPVLADGTAAKPYYRQGRTLWAPSAFVDLFHKPYRGDAASEFRGSESGPDILISDTIGAVDFLDKINQALFTDQSRTGRISQIAIFAPPTIPVGGVMKRAGICTLKITVAKYRGMGLIGVVPVVTGSSVKVGERVVKAILGEVPGTLASGPLESCGPLSVTGAVNAHWGKVI